MRNRDEKERAKLQSQIELPPAGQEIPAESVWSDENVMAAFQVAMQEG